MKRILREKHFTYLGFATLDDMGRVFKYKGKIFRGIYPAQVERVQKLFDSGLLQDLIRQKLFVDTKMTNLVSDSYPMIIAHESVTAALPTDWSLLQLKDVAKLILEVNTLCNKYGYELSDAHPYNVCFSSNTPKWIDLGSIRTKVGEKWRARKEFTEATLLPLVFMANNELLLAYSMLQAGRTFKLYTKSFRESVVFRDFEKLVREYSEDFSEDLVDTEWIDQYISSKIPAKSFWGKYQGTSDSLSSNLIVRPKNKFKRFFQLAGLINKYAPDARSSVDLAGNSGLLSLIVSRSTKLQKLFSVDYDTQAIDTGYKFLQENPHNKVELYVQNFMLPMQEHSVSALKSDIAFAFAITHHLLLTQGFKIDGIFENIEKFSNKYVFIEFMPLGLWSKDQVREQKPPEWYSVDWFASKFTQRYKLLGKFILETQLINEQQVPHRILFIGEIMKKQPLVSVVTVTKDIIASGRKEHFLQCLKSVHTQKYSNLEHIVIDGASVDGTKELLDEYAGKGWITYYSESDTGIYEAMNKGVTLSKGEYITFLNSDDLYSSSNALDVVVKQLTETHADFSYGPVNVVNFDGTKPSKTHYHENPVVSDMFVHMPFSHQSMFFKRSILLRENMYDTDFKYAGDYDLTLRLCLGGYQGILINEKFVTYRKNGKTDQNAAESSEEACRALFKNFSPLIEISMSECQKIYATDITKIPSRLAEKLRKYKPYFNFLRYTRLLYEQLEKNEALIGTVTKHPIVRVTRRCIKIFIGLAQNVRQILFPQKRTVDMMELWHNQHIDTALSHLQIPRNEIKALVIGCNRGEECEIMYNKGVRDVSGIDLIDELGIKFHNKGVKYYSGYAENMYLFEDNTYDLVYSFATFEHVQDIENAYKEAARVTKPGGIIYIFASPLWNSPYGHHYDNIYMGHPWIHLRYSEKELVEFCEQNNLNTNAERIDHMLNSKEFNRRSSYEYVEACNNVPNVRLISNQVAHVDPAMEKQIDPKILKKGYTTEDLMSIWHLFIARKN
ncbi:glycosyltransferase, partial [bacterium]|nr:glycosyltransferase [bacterium]